MPIALRSPLDLPADLAFLFALGAGLLFVTWLVRTGLRRVRGLDLSDHDRRFRTWLFVIGTLMAAVSLGELVTLLLFAAVSLQCLREYLALLPVPLGRRLEVVAYSLVGLQFALFVPGFGTFALDRMPALVALAVPVLSVALGDPGRSLAQFGGLFFGYALTGFALSHVAALGTLPLRPGVAPPSAVSSLLALVIVADIFQYVWGRALGRYKVTPVLSPNKTWEGLVLGALTCGVFACVAVPRLLPLGGWESFALGVGTCLAAFAGDVTQSAIKRHASVKDSGTLLPGMGGLFDRCDSLVFAAPMWVFVLRFA